MKEKLSQIYTRISKYISFDIFSKLCGAILILGIFQYGILDDENDIYPVAYQAKIAQQTIANSQDIKNITDEKKMTSWWDKIQLNPKHFRRTLQLWEANFFDWRYRNFINKYDRYKFSELPPSEKNENLVVLAIDDASLTAIGRWPWPRNIQAEIVNKLHSLGARTIAFDILYSEVDQNPENDKKLSEAVQKFQEDESDQHSAVFSYYLIDSYKDALNGIQSRPLIPTSQHFMFSFLNRNQKLTQNRIQTNDIQINRDLFVIETLLEKSPSLGFITVSQDIDGVFRHITFINTMSFNINSENYANTISEKSLLPNLGLAIYNAHRTDPTKEVFYSEVDHSSTSQMQLIKLDSSIDKNAMHLDITGAARIRYLGGPNRFDYITVKQLFDAKTPEAISALKIRLNKKAVLIGSTAEGAYDLRNTPIDSALAGLYVHANVFHMFDKDYFWKDFNEYKFDNFFLFIITAVIIFFISSYFAPLWGALALTIIILGTYWLDSKLFLPDGYRLKLINIYFAISGIYVWNTLLNVYRESKERQRVQGTFSRYVAPSVVKQMLSNPELLRVGGEKKEITMLFSDVRDFTSISEKLSPQELSTLLNIYMGKMTDILFATYGTLDKYIGDALVGFWGAPVDVPDHPYHAVRAAKQMVECLPAINEEFKKRNFPEISVGLGLNTGEVSVGNMGSDKIFQYTALGDNMNLASRLEGLTKYYGVQIMISEYTYEKLYSHQKEFIVRPLDMVQVKGKSQPVKIFEVLPAQHPMYNDQQSIELYKKAYALYLARNFSDAKEIFSSLTQRYTKDKASLRLLESCIEFIQQPPAADWNGVSIFTTK